jgi:hypothetical protein
MKIAAGAWRQVELVFAPHESEKNGLKHVLCIDRAPCHAIRGPKDLVVMFAKQKLSFLGRSGHGSEVFNGLHVFLLHFVSSHETLLRSEY